MEQRKNRRVLNFRAFLLIAAVIAAAVFCGVLAEFNERISWIIFFVCLFAAAGVILLAFAFIKEKHKTIAIIISCIVFIAVFLNLRIVFETRFDSRLSDGNAYQVSGVVDDIYKTGSDFNIIIKDTFISGEKVSGKLKISVAIPKGDSIIFYVKAGDKVSFTGNIYFLKLIKNNKVNTSYFVTNQRYSAYPDSAADLSFTPGQAAGLKSFSLNVESVLTDFLGEEMGALAFGMITGDKSGISAETRDSFSASGLGHILSVSGLHIAFICLMLTALFNLLKVNKKVSFFIIIGFLIFYMFFADFSSSVIRAVIMCAVMLASKLVFHQYDPLSSLCLAMSVILLIFPIYLFDVGFILSAGAVYAMILFTKPVLKALIKIKIPKFIAMPVSTVVAVQFGIFPAMVYFFGEIQIYSALTNFLLMPILTIAFIFIFAALILTLISPVFSVVLSISGIPLAFVDTVSYAVSLLPYSVIFYSSTSLIFVCYPLYLFFSRFYMPLHKISPVKIASSLLSVALFLNGFYLIPVQDYNNVIIPLNYSGASSIVIDDKKTYLIGDFPSIYIVEEYVKKKYIKKIDAILLTNLNEYTAQEIVRLNKNIQINKIFISRYSDLSGISVLTENYVENLFAFDSGDIICGIFEGVIQNNKFLAYKMKTAQSQILFCDRLYLNYENFKSAFYASSIIRTYYYTEGSENKIYLYNYAAGEINEYCRNYENIFCFDTGEIYKNLI